jgi:hypothetical protein
MFKNKTLVVIGVVGALALLLGGVAYAYAQGPQPPVDGRPFYGRGRLPGGGTFGFGGVLFDEVPMRGRYPLVDATAEVTGLSEEEVIAALSEGQTFADIAEGAGVDPQKIVDAAVTEHEERLQAAVDTGRLTNEQMKQMLEDIKEHVTDQLDETHEPRFFGGGRFGGGLLDRFGGGSWTTMFDAVAEALGLDPTGLFTELHEGKSLAEIAEEQGVELEKVREAVEAERVKARKEAIEQAVEDGRLSEEQGEWMLEGLEEGYILGGRGFAPGQNCGPGGGFAPGRGGRGRGMGW